jgi:hypothetical protein
MTLYKYPYIAFSDIVGGKIGLKLRRQMIKYAVNSIRQGEIGNSYLIISCRWKSSCKMGEGEF